MEKKPVKSSVDYFHFGDLLDKKTNETRIALRKIFEAEILPKSAEYNDKALYPHYLRALYRKLELGKHLNDKPYGFSTPLMSQAVFVMELARIDLSATLVAAVSLKLAGNTIGLYGTKEQKEKYLPRLMNMEIIGGWAFTEPEAGSDARGLRTTA